MELEWFLSRDQMNDLFFDALEFDDPVEMTEISWDDLADGVYFTLEVSDRDAEKIAMYGADIEA